MLGEITVFCDLRKLSLFGVFFLMVVTNWECIILLMLLLFGLQKLQWKLYNLVWDHLLLSVTIWELMRLEPSFPLLQVVLAVVL